MSTQQVQCQILGHEVAGEIVDTTLEADAGTGPREIVTVDVGGARFRVDGADVDPR